MLQKNGEYLRVAYGRASFLVVKSQKKIFWPDFITLSRKVINKLTLKFWWILQKILFFFVKISDN